MEELIIAHVRQTLEKTRLDMKRNVVKRQLEIVKRHHRALISKLEKALMEVEEEEEEAEAEKKKKKQQEEVVVQQPRKKRGRPPKAKKTEIITPKIGRRATSVFDTATTSSGEEQEADPDEEYSPAAKRAKKAEGSVIL